MSRLNIGWFPPKRSVGQEITQSAEKLLHIKNIRLSSASKCHVHLTQTCAHLLSDMSLHQFAKNIVGRSDAMWIEWELVAVRSSKRRDE